MAEECGGEKLEGIDPTAVQNPNTLQPNGVPAEGGIGLIQWTGGRKDALVAFALQRGKDWRDLPTQLDFFWDELFVRKSGWTSPADVDRFKQCTTPQQAAEFFFTYCEMQSESLAKEKWEEFAVERVRVPEANRAYQLMRTSGGNGATAGKVDYINQGDYSHVPFNRAYSSYGSSANIQTSGCGICSIVMVLRYYGINITVEEAAQIGDSDTSYNPTQDLAAFTLFATKYGLPAPVQTSSVNEACDACRNGKIAIAHVDGHYYVIQGWGAVGPFVYDPGYRARTEDNTSSGKGESPAEIASGTHEKKGRSALTFFIY